MLINACHKNGLWRRGTVAALVGITLPLIVGVTAIGLDGGVMYLQRRQAQSAADSAALAAAYALNNGASFASAQTAAAKIGSENGITITNAQITQPTASTVAVSGHFLETQDVQRDLGGRDHDSHGNRDRLMGPVNVAGDTLFHLSGRLTQHGQSVNGAKFVPDGECQADRQCGCSGQFE